MITNYDTPEARDYIHSEIQSLVGALGTGVTLGTAYDTSWGARLAPHYPRHGFEASLDWLRRNQWADGSWGGPLLHYHDRFVSTLAAMIALTEAGAGPDDKRRVERGERAVWQLVGQLGRDDSDTVGFPVVAASLADEAASLGLDVPTAPTRFAKAYRRKVEMLLQAPERNWLSSSLTHSFEALRHAAHPHDNVRETNGSVGASLSATAGYLLTQRDPASLSYIVGAMMHRNDGSLPAVWPIDTFELIWSLSHLRTIGVVDPADSYIQSLLRVLADAWSPETGLGTSTQWRVKDIDDSAAAYTLLTWGGYNISDTVFDTYEADDYFMCYIGETNPSLSAHVRLLAALRQHDERTPRNLERINKIVRVLYQQDENGAFWWDKWHASPYYVTSFALTALHGLADDLVYSRMKWIINTQRGDGGWGYLGASTAEETAYCLHVLLQWDNMGLTVDRSRIQQAAAFLQQNLHDDAFVPLWIGKSLYTPYYPVKAAVLSALFAYYEHSDGW